MGIGPGLWRSAEGRGGARRGIERGVVGWPLARS